MVFVVWIAIFVGIFYAGFPIVGTLGIFALALQSMGVVFRLKSSPDWYYAQCTAHSIEPNIKSAIITKIVMAAICVAIGAWLAFQAESKGLL